MSKTSKTVLIVAAIIVAVGILVGGGGFVFAYNGRNSTSYTERSKDFQSGYNKLSINIDQGDITVKCGSTDGIHVDYRDSDNDEMIFDDNNGSLNISSDSQPFSFNFFNIFNFDSDIYDVKVTLPNSFDGEIIVSTHSGDVDLSGIKTAKGLDLSSTSGDIKLSDIECSSLTADATSGEIIIDDVKAESSVMLDSTSGDIGGSNIACTEFSAENTSGDTGISNISSETLEIKSTSGEVGLKGIDVSKSINIKSTSGDVMAAVNDGIDNYHISCDTGSGDSNLPDNYGNGSKELSVDVGSGDVYFTFNAK